MDKATKIIIYLIIGALAIGILRNSSGFALSTGTLFNGFNTSLSLLSGGSPSIGGSAPANTVPNTGA